ncbi:hypothetical protein PORCAN_809 [Porphyromonas crevioricanis JCM 13913]|nr:hypothetical protein PORCAN_809 [Porphyromonas crevioricanis JCM 13913]
MESEGNVFRIRIQNPNVNNSVVNVAWSEEFIYFILGRYNHKTVTTAFTEHDM